MSLKSHRREDPNSYNVDLHRCSKEMGIQTSPLDGPESCTLIFYECSALETKGAFQWVLAIL